MPQEQTVRRAERPAYFGELISPSKMEQPIVPFPDHYIAGKWANPVFFFLHFQEHHFSPFIFFNQRIKGCLVQTGIFYYYQMAV
jgi:hypothetical protein